MTLQNQHPEIVDFFEAVHKHPDSLSWDKAINEVLQAVNQSGEFVLDGSQTKSGHPEIYDDGFFVLRMQ